MSDWAGAAARPMGRISSHPVPQAASFTSDSSSGATTIAAGRACSTMRRSRRAGCAGSSGQYAAPLSMIASRATGRSTERPAHTPTTQPRPTPRSASTARKLSTRCHIRSYVRLSLLSLRAMAFGVRATCAATYPSSGTRRSNSTRGPRSNPAMSLTRAAPGRGSDARAYPRARRSHRHNRWLPRYRRRGSSRRTAPPAPPCPSRRRSHGAR